MAHLAKSSNLLTTVIWGLPGAPGKQWENDHHNFTKKRLLSFIILQCLGRIQNGNVVQTSWNHQLDSQRVIQLVGKISTSPLLKFKNNFVIVLHKVHETMLTWKM